MPKDILKQSELKDKLLEILGINKDKNFFTLYDIDNNEELRNKIIGLEEEIKECFLVSQWSYFRYSRENKLMPRPYLTLIRNVLSACNVVFYNKPMSFTVDDIKIITVKYIIA